MSNDFRVSHANHPKALSVFAFGGSTDKDGVLTCATMTCRALVCACVCVSVSLYTFPLRAPLQPPSPGKPIYYSVLQAFRALLSIRHPSPTANTMFTTVHHHHLVQSNHLNLCYCSYSLYFIFHLCPNLCPHACTNQCQVVLTLTFPPR